jgi:hypothetical protein
MAQQGSTYSFKDLSGAFVSPLAGVFTMSGNIGMGNVTVVKSTERTAHDTAPDGTVVPSFIDGDSGMVTIECQQTSLLHKFLLEWDNVHETVAKNGDVSLWAASSMLLRNVVDGTSHVATGISPQKSADKSYSSSGGKVTWQLPACNIINQ